ncbi:unnamed protein product [Phaedon cochleariae]|uniref:BED-type domain-containing protein n=1 Tax=Phaedon cochleariae TaxID=80249 RepID=A0A9N9X105_PHACE|nr:unnamed protein product [Phaedon cochleariae]
MKKFITINRSQLEPSPSTSVVVLPEKNEVRERDANIEDEARYENEERADNLVEDTDVEEEIDNRRKRPKVSKVWNFHKKSGDKKFAKFLNCGKEYKTSGNTSNLSDHLKRFHPRLLGKPHDYDRNNVDGSDTDKESLTASSSARSSNRSISPFFKRLNEYDTDSPKKKEIDRSLAFMIAKDFQPYNVVNDEGFKSFVHHLNPRLFLYEKRTVTQMGTLLDPAFKQEGFRIIDNAKAAGQFMENEMLVMLNKDVKEPDSKGSISNDEDDLDSSDRASSLFSFMTERTNQKIKSKKVDAIIVKRQYFERQNTNQNSDPLLFWKINGNELHPLQHCAKKYLCIPALSVESERQGRLLRTDGQD